MNLLSKLSAPEMMRTHPLHAGTSKLVSNLNGKPEGNENTSSVKPGSFQSYLISAVNSVNEQQLEVGRLEKQLITDPDSVNPEIITTAMAKAQMSLSLAQTVIDRLVQGWSELQTTR